MSKIIFDNFDQFDIGNKVSFDHNGKRLTGAIVRVYNTRDLYHVDVNGQRYQVNPIYDCMKVS